MDPHDVTMGDQEILHLTSLIGSASHYSRITPLGVRVVLLRALYQSSCRQTSCPLPLTLKNLTNCYTHLTDFHRGFPSQFSLTPSPPPSQLTTPERQQPALPPHETSCHQSLSRSIIFPSIPDDIRNSGGRSLLEENSSVTVSDANSSLLTHRHKGWFHWRDLLNYWGPRSADCDVPLDLVPIGCNPLEKIKPFSLLPNRSDPVETLNFPGQGCDIQAL